MPTTPTWIYLGNDSTQINPSGGVTGTTLAQAQGVVGKSFSGSDMQGVMVSGNPTNSNETNFARGIDELTYSLADENGTGTSSYTSVYTSHVVVNTAVSVARADANNPGAVIRDTINLRGVIIQMENGDFFMRPFYTDTAQWNDTLRNWGVTGITIGAIDTSSGSTATDAATGGLNAAASFNPIFFNQGTFVPCFVAGTLIATEFGSRPVETLVAGDCVWTRDNGLQPIRWIGARHLDAMALNRAAKLKPIRIRAHALAPQTPSTDLLVSPQHRVLLHSRTAQKLFGTDQVLVAAKQLLALDGVEIAEDLAEVTYVHILFDQHEIVRSNDVETESLYTGPEALRSVGPAAREEILTLFPELEDPAFLPQPARRLLTGREARALVRRHINNNRNLVPNEPRPS
ncbi:Hint domain-containing protein [Paracoccus cavernae]|uniref:Hint domain-containing protein n=1 Tax=Paracoccus cavernae TaxID=1571207 RepID=A0ABT8D9M6_9RHOB|nr:Hint domain-containing protein [Paracoccus cavernae]